MQDPQGGAVVVDRYAWPHFHFCWFSNNTAAIPNMSTNASDATSGMFRNADGAGGAVQVGGAMATFDSECLS